MSTMEPDEGNQADGPRWERADAARAPSGPRWERTEGEDTDPDDAESDDSTDS
jgi:hypothetical protein